MHSLRHCVLLPAINMKALLGLPDKDEEECYENPCEDGQRS